MFLKFWGLVVVIIFLTSGFNLPQPPSPVERGVAIRALLEVNAPRPPVTDTRSSFLISPAIEKLQSLSDGKDRTLGFVGVHVGGRRRLFQRGRWYEVPRIKAPVGRSIVLHRVFVYDPGGDAAAVNDHQYDYYNNDDVDDEVGEGCSDSSKHCLYGGTNTEKGNRLLIGEPFLEHVRVVASVDEHYRGPKKRLFKFRAKKHYRRHIGFRTELTRLTIQDISLIGTEEELCSSGWQGLHSDPLYRLMIDVKHHSLGGSSVVNKVRRGGLGSSSSIITSNTTRGSGDLLEGFDLMDEMTLIDTVRNHG